MTPDQKALLTKARQSLAAGRVLAQQGFADFAVSRCYATGRKWGLSLSVVQGTVPIFSGRGPVR